MSDQVPTPVLSLFGWCQTQGKPDHYHGLCRRNYRSQFGVDHQCSCPAHADDESPLVDSDSRQNKVDSETKRGPDRANESDPLATVSTRPKGA